LLLKNQTDFFLKTTNQLWHLQDFIVIIQVAVIVCFDLLKIYHSVHLEQIYLFHQDFFQILQNKNFQYDFRNS